MAINTAQSLVLFVKFGAHRLAAVAARVPSSKGQIPCISRLRISFDGAMGLVYDEFGARRLAAVAARVPSSKGQIPCISRL